MSDQITLLFDVKQRRLACVLLQSIAGCDYQHAHLFNSRDWLTEPTPDMQRVTGTKAEWQRVVDSLAPSEREP